MSYRGVTFDKELKKSMDDAMIYDTFLNHANGSLKGCEVTKVSNHVHISPGYFILAGRLINIYRTEMLSPEQGLEKKYTRLVFTINLSKHNTETNFNQGYFEFLSSSTTYPEPVQEDLFGGGKIYQLPICKFEISEEYGITNFVNELVLLDIGTITGQIEAIETIINDIENGKYATVEELENVEKEVQELDKDLEETNTKVTDVEKELTETNTKVDVVDRRIINKNLLINANFKVSELINQRGTTNYTIDNVRRYTFDQWLAYTEAAESMPYPKANLDLTGEYVKFNRTSGDSLYTNRTYIRQYFENPEFFKDQKVTISVALKSNSPTKENETGLRIEVKTNTGINWSHQTFPLTGNKEVISATFDIPSSLDGIYIYNDKIQELEIYGIKLEFGDKSTLYFEDKKDKNDSEITHKVLCGLDDDIPATKLMKCQRYLQKLKIMQTPSLSDNGNQLFFYFDGALPIRYVGTVPAKILTDFFLHYYDTTSNAWKVLNLGGVGDTINVYTASGIPHIEINNTLTPPNKVTLKPYVYHIANASYLAGNVMSVPVYILVSAEL